MIYQIILLLKNCQFILIPIYFNILKSNLLIGDIFSLQFNPPEDKRGKKSDDEGVQNFQRPEINGEYDGELNDEDLLFSYEKLRINQSTETLRNAEILFILDLGLKDGDPEKLKQKQKEFKDKVQIFKDLHQEKPSFVCRVYLINLSNVTFDDSMQKENAFYWIKRWETDSNFKQDKKFFDLEDGEINDSVSMLLKWPVKTILCIILNIIHVDKIK